MDTLLGFDPGGAGSYGWCVLKDQATLPLSVHCMDVANNAQQAVEAALKAAESTHGRVAAAGIDAPLLWVPAGDRNVDQIVRTRICDLGAPSGTVQHVNSLRGACLVQGVLAALLLRRSLPEIQISESHPKALLWLIGTATPENPPSGIPLSQLHSHFDSVPDNPSDHERDAALGALSAWAMVHRPAGWRDLYAQEDQAISPIANNLAYWLPV
jgi:hypothetical protein